MMTLIFFLIISVVLVLGSAMVLLRTAKKPKLPKSASAKPYDDEEDEDQSW